MLSDVITRVRVLISALVPYLVAASAFLVVVEGELGKIGGVPEVVTQWVARVATVLAAAIAIVRRVTPVIPEDRGLLPPDRPANPDVTAANANVPPYDEGAVNVSTLLCVLALVCFIIFTLIAHGTFTSDEGFTWLGGGLALWVAASFAP